MPTRTFSGSNTGFNTGPVGIALDDVNDEYVVTTPFFEAQFQPAILWFPRLPGGNVAPNRVIGGTQSTTQLATPNGVVVDRAAVLGGPVSAGTTLFWIVAPGARTVLAKVPETLASRLDVGEVERTETPFGRKTQVIDCSWIQTNDA